MLKIVGINKDKGIVKSLSKYQVNRFVTTKKTLDILVSEGSKANNKTLFIIESHQFNEKANESNFKIFD